jgi:LysR family transcriptional regulator, low CO2-responsive transcriptional regulator
MRHATLRQLKVFEAAARLSSFSRAAQEMHLSQPAVSAQIDKLRGHAGVPLFEQLGKRIHLTAAGEELLHHARLILAQFDQAEAAMAQHQGVKGGRLNVAVISAGDSFFPRLLVAFAQRHEGVKLALSVQNRHELLVHLADNQCDLAVMVRPPAGPEMTATPFAPHPYIVVAARSHALAQERAITLARLLREPFLVREAGSDTRASMAEAFGKRMAKLNIALEIKSNETIKQAVLAGMGLAFMSAHTVSAELKAGTLVALDVQGFPLQRHWYVVQRRDKRLPAVAQAFRDFLIDEAAALIDAAPARGKGGAARKLAR